MAIRPRLEAALASDLPAIRSLLRDLRLPADDVGAENQHFLVAREGADLAGCVGLELHADGALLRSLAVTPGRQGSGLGRALCAGALAEARSRGVREVYLLTTTAEGFFAKEGFARIERGQVPQGVSRSAEFRSLCPATAACMARRLS